MLAGVFDPASFSGHRVLITGGAGFIGTALTEAIIEENQVTLLDRSFEDNSIALSKAWGHKNLSFSDTSILDEAAVKEVVKGYDTIVHLAAVVGVKNVLSRGRETIEVNFTGTRNLLKAVEDRDDIHRFVYFSTSEVMGMNAFRAGEDALASIGPVSEARWTYSIAKLAGEHLVYCYHREIGLPTVTIRPFNVFGPLRLGDHAMLRFILNAKQGDKLEVHGDGTQIRSWCFIDDFVDALVRVLAIPEAVGETFNIGNSRNTLTILDLAERVIAQMGSSSEVEFVDIDFSDIDVRVPRLKKAAELLGYHPSVGLHEAIGKTAAWYTEHYDRVASSLQSTDPVATADPVEATDPVEARVAP